MEPGLSFIIRAKNEALNVRLCLDSLRPIFENNRNIEIIYVDNNSTDDTFKIASEYSGKYPNVKVYQYPINIAKCGKEHQHSVKHDTMRTVTTYYNWCLDKATKSNIIKWDADLVANVPNLQRMISEFKLESRVDRFSLWCTGETVFIHESQVYKKNHSSYDEFRCFSKYQGFCWEDSKDGNWETFAGRYFSTLPVLVFHEYREFINSNRRYFSNPDISIKEKCRYLSEHGYQYVGDHIDCKDGDHSSKYYVVDSNFNLDHNWYFIKDYNGVRRDGIHGWRENFPDPVFYEIKRTNIDEFSSRDSLLDIRDQVDHKILSSLKSGQPCEEVSKMDISIYL